MDGTVMTGGGEAGHVVEPSRAPLGTRRIRVHSLLGREEHTLGADVIEGMRQPLKELPPKHFYDSRGAALFDRICELPEYYPTRTERAILEAHAGEIIALTGAAELVELGSGTASKTRILLEAMDAAGSLRLYVPIDVTETMVREVAAALATEYGRLEIHGIVGDFERHLGHVPPPRGPRIVALLGGTIGNLTEEQRRGFLRTVTPLLGDGGHLLLGTDLVKDVDVIEAAYNDSQGVTAEFNLNVLEVMNRELGADFDVDAFDHVAFFDRDEEWIEMRLRAQREMHVTFPTLDLRVSFEAGEEMRTEISSKFTSERLADDLSAAGLTPKAQFTDRDGLYRLTLAARS